MKETFAILAVGALIVKCVGDEEYILEQFLQMAVSLKRKCRWTVSILRDIGLRCKNKVLPMGGVIYAKGFNPIAKGMGKIREAGSCIFAKKSGENGF